MNEQRFKKALLSPSVIPSFDSIIECTISKANMDGDVRKAEYLDFADMSKDYSIEDFSIENSLQNGIDNFRPLKFTRDGFANSDNLDEVVSHLGSVRDSLRDSGNSSLKVASEVQSEAKSE